MSKDSYWFRHDSTAGRGLKLRKIQHIYGHAGKGLYWDVVEMLREQQNYRYPKDDSSLQMLASLVGCKDDILFLSWFHDCIKIGLFEIYNDKFLCPPLLKNMINWEKQKRNGSQLKAKPKPTHKPNRNIRGEESREEDIIVEEKIEGKRKELRLLLIDDYTHFLKKIKVPLMFDGSDGKALNRVMGVEEVRGVLQLIYDTWDMQEPFYQKQVRLRQIVANLPNLVKAINGQRKKITHNAGTAEEHAADPGL